MEAACVAAQRGHDVTLLEKLDQLGGMMRLAAVPGFKKDLRDFLQYQQRRLQQRGVRVLTGVKATVELAQQETPEAVVVATGALPYKPAIPGIDSPGTYEALEVLAGRIPEGKRVVVCGGNLIGLELAMFLVESHGKQVVLVKRSPAIAPLETKSTRWLLQGRLAEDGIDIRVGHALKFIEATRVVCDVEGRDSVIEGDSVVLALGMVADHTLYDSLKQLPAKVIAIGDAVQARKIVNAVHEGYHVACRI